MTKIEVITIPQSREDSDITEKYLTILDEKNKLVAKRFGMNEEDVTLEFYDTKGALVSSLGPNQNGYGIYSGYVDGTNEIKVLHPAAAEGLLNDIPKEISILIDSALTKLYLCKKYYPEDKDFKLYYKYVSDIFSKISAGNFPVKSCKFDMKIYFDGIKYKKDQELGIALYIMLKNSGLEYIHEHLDEIMKDCKISKTIETIYNKPLGELIKPEKEIILEEERKVQELEKQKRAAQREAMINERKERELKFAQNKRNSNGETSPKRVHISSQKYGTKTTQTSKSPTNQSTTPNRTYKKYTNNKPGQDSTLSNREKANQNNPNNPNYKGNKDSSTKKPAPKSNKSDEPANKPQKFATPKVN